METRSALLCRCDLRENTLLYFAANRVIKELPVSVEPMCNTVGVDKDTIGG